MDFRCPLSPNISVVLSNPLRVLQDVLYALLISITSMELAADEAFGTEKMGLPVAEGIFGLIMSQSDGTQYFTKDMSGKKISYRFI